jgi:hypothetical protein
MMVSIELLKRASVHLFRMLLAILVVIFSFLFLLILGCLIARLAAILRIITTTPLLTLLAATFCGIGVVKVTPVLLKKFNLSFRVDLIDLLELINLKIKYYKFSVFMLKVWNSFALLLQLLLEIFVILIILLVLGVHFSNPFGPLMPDSLKNYYDYLFGNGFLNFIVKFLVPIIPIYLGIMFYGMILFWFMFPTDKNTGLPVTLEIPIFSIEKAILELNQFSFSEDEEIRQNRKNRILNLVTDAFEFITLEEKFFGIPLGLRFHRTIFGDIKSKAVIVDSAYRINGMSIKLEKTMISINNMNNDIQKEEVIHDLSEYLDVMKTKDPSRYEPVPYTSRGLLYKLLLRNNFVDLLKGILEIVHK